MTLEEELLAAWRRHNTILLYLLENIPKAGMAAVPTGSRGRTVAGQFEHLDRVRRVWLHHHATGQRVKMDRADKEKPPGAAELKQALTGSGALVEEWLAKALAGQAKIRMFGRQPRGCGASGCREREARPCACVSDVLFAAHAQHLKSEGTGYCAKRL